jgi:hypothetical protein
MPGASVDHNDAVEMFEAAGEAVNRARRGGGPTLIEVQTDRYLGHFQGDAEVYRPKGEADGCDNAIRSRSLRSSCEARERSTTPSMTRSNRALRTGGLLDRFGPERVIDTPISEAGFIGAAIGAAAQGMRPIAELMFVDFFGVCMDQIYNHLAKNTYMSDGNVKLPVVITTAIGGGYSDAAQHSQYLYATLAHMPGLSSRIASIIRPLAS